MWHSLAGYVGSIHYLHPGWLWCWPLSAITAGLLLRAHRIAPLSRLPALLGTRPYRHPRLNALRQLHGGLRGQRSGYGPARQWAHYALFLLCAHLALAHPYRLGAQLPTPPEYRDTLFLIDTSISMELRDYLIAGKRVERMTILKGVLTHFIDQLRGNRIGLIAFSAQPYTLAPLSADYALLKARVRRLRPAALTGRSSDLGKALLYTLQQLQRRRAAPGAPKPALVLLTDVNRTERDVDPRAVAAYLHRQGYRLYTIGIGAASYAAGEKETAGLIYQPANFALLRAIAERGGGHFYWADSVASLQAAVHAIQSAERRPIRATPRYISRPLYQWPLLAGLVWLALLQLLPTAERRP